MGEWTWCVVLSQTAGSHPASLGGPRPERRCRSLRGEVSRQKGPSLGLSREPSLTTEPFSSQITSQNTQWDQRRRMKTLMSVLKVASVFLFFYHTSSHFTSHCLLSPLFLYKMLICRKSKDCR